MGKIIGTNADEKVDGGTNALYSSVLLHKWCGKSCVPKFKDRFALIAQAKQ